MTDPGIADATYIEPLNIKSLTEIIAKESPDAVLPNLGGQMALNLCSELSKLGVLEEYGVKVIGVQIDAIERGEDRIEFKNTMANLGIDMPRSMASYSVEEAERIAEELGYPVVIRPAYTMGGTGGGLVYNLEELRVIAARGIAASMVGQILVEESVLGWEELELEVVRDSKNQMITVCFIENIDAVGVHTGDSICAAPMLTISEELQKRLQKYSYDVVEAIGVIGGTNVQFAHDPKTGRVVIIEINPRTSRSSALASKATGFPIAYVSSLLAAGLTLDEIPYWRDGTLDKYTPSGDYVVIKFPRWAFEKFPGSIDKLGTQMRAVGEVMSIGKNYKEAMQKAIRSLEIGRYGLGFAKDFNEKTLDELLILLAEPCSERQFIMYEALRKGADIDTLYSLTYIKPYFLEQMKELVTLEEDLLKYRGTPLPDELLIKAKKDGFSDRYLSKILGISESQIRENRTKVGAVEGWEAVPVSGVENASYYFSTYNAPDATTVSNRKKVMVLGGGPNRIGQGIEFDYCCVHAAYTLKDLGYETVMVNCNPETVSTDYDTSDKLYFEPLTVEDVLSIYEKEKPEGIIVSFGGQTPLNIAGELEKAGVKILGTSQETIDLAEDRDLFRKIMEKLEIPMPESGMAVNVEEAIEIAHRIGYPLMVRPSYVLGGRGMKVVHDDEMLRQYMISAVGVTKERPILVDRFLKDATEAEADAIADGKDAFVPTVMEHIEYAGIHSGDSACVIPPISIREDHLNTIVEYTKKIAKEMKVVGLMNMQYAIEGDKVYVLEANPRGSRTVPLVSKVCNIPMASIATEIIMAVNSGENYDMSQLVNRKIPHYGVKEAVLPFNMFPEVHPVLGPEMRSTGEVLGMADSFELAYVKAQESTAFPLPTSGTVLISVNDNDKQEVLKAARVFMEVGFKIRATTGTCSFLKKNGVNCEEIKKLHEGRPNISDSIHNKEIRLIINTPSSRISEFDDISICMLAVRNKVPYITTMTAAYASAKGIEAYIKNNFPLSMKRSLQEYHEDIR
jgi:carbamoyl-phosphate synthase large subunit